MSADQDQALLRLAAYLRVSDMGEREEASDSFHSTDFQDEDVFRWSERNRAEIVVLRKELNLSGANWEKRKGFQECVELVESGEVDGVIVAYSSRFARHMRVAYQALGRIMDAGGFVICVQEGIDTRTRQGRTNFNLRMSMAQDEWEMKREEFMRVQQAKIKKGIPMRTCFGYLRGPLGTLVPCPVQSPWVPVIFEWRIAGLGWREIAHRLNTDPTAPAPSKKSRSWTPTTVRDLIGRRTYLGEVWHDKERKNVTQDAHQPLIDELDWLRANRVMGGQRFERHRHHLLSGLLYCAGCRYKMKAGTSKPRGEAEYVSYFCRGTHGGGECADPARVTELQLLPILRRDWLRTANAEGKVFQARGNDEQLQRVEAELDILEERYQRHLRDDDARDEDEKSWQAGRREKKAARDTKLDEKSDILRALHAEHPTGRQPMGWTDDPVGQRVLLKETFSGVFLRGREGALDASRVKIIGSWEQMPNVPTPGKVFDARPLTWTGEAPARAGEA